MENLNFIPHWYKILKEKRIIRTVKIFIYFFISLNFISFIIMYHYINVYDNLIDSYKTTEKYEVKDNINTDNFSKNKVINNCNTFIKLTDSNIKYMSAIININTIEIEIIYNDFTKYYNDVKYLEQQPNIYIKSLSPPSEDKGELTFKIVLGVKN